VLPLRFVPEPSIAGIPNVVVDGSPNGDTVLTLSHWPGMPTPPELRDDLSAQIAFRALAEPQRFDRVGAVTNNHFDQDGLTSAYALTRPDLALPHREQLIDIARAGDFGTFEMRDSARIAMCIAALDDDGLSPVPGELLSVPYPQRCGNLYEWTLPRLGEMLEHPDRWRDLWAEEDAHLAESEAAIRSGVIAIVEHPAVDLAVVDVPEVWGQRATHRFTQAWTEAVHPMAVNCATDCLRIALIQGQRFRLELRYESWVMLTSRAVLPRPDLATLAAELTALEPAGARWKGEQAGALTPKLALVDDAHSGLSPQTFVTHVQRFLATAPPAWDPFAGT
jgi:hypothetical protein